MSPPDRPAKKPPEREPLEGIDLTDFEDPQESVAGLRLDGPEPASPERAVDPEPALVPPAPPEAVIPEASPAPALEEAPGPAPSYHEEGPLPKAPFPPPLESAPAAPAAPTLAAFPAPSPAAAAAPPTVFPPTPPSPYAYSYPVQFYPGYGPLPAAGSPYPLVYAQGPLVRPTPSATAAGLMRLHTGALLAAAFFATLALHHAFVATTGVSDAPGVRGQAPVGLQFLSYFLYGTALVALGLAISAGASALALLGDARGEFADTSAPVPRRAYQVMGLGLLLPLAAAVAAWLMMAQVQRSMPGSGTGSDLGLSRLFDNYRVVALLSACSQLGAAFLVVGGLSAALKPLSPLAPRKDFRAFGALLVLGAAVGSALTLVLFFALLSPPTLTAGESPSAAYGLLLTGPLLSAVALLFLLRYLKAASAEAERRHKAKTTSANSTG